ncbi:MAG: dipeptide epimerase [Hyphomicrobium sp.]|nr:MAG: dipeptide epimerase [Hyphomicrobium sp.]
MSSDPTAPSLIAKSASAENWPLAEPFVISRGSKTEARVVVVTVTRGGFMGRGESVPYARFGETVESVLAAIRGSPVVCDRSQLRDTLPPGAARNALDCAFWDLEAKESGRTVHEACGFERLAALETCFTLSLATPAEMAAKAQVVSHLKLLKLKLGGAGDAERMAAVRKARPDARLVADANEAWTPDMLGTLLAAAHAHRFELIEQPLPAGADEALRDLPRAVPICADESAHVTADLGRLTGLYDAVNIKLDKAGGLTEALRMASAAEARGLKIMAGCMVATSLAMAPAVILAQRAQWVDLDGPLLLARDRPHGLTIRDGIIAPPSPALWG